MNLNIDINMLRDMLTGDEAYERREIAKFLYRLVEQLKAVLDNLDEENLTAEMTQEWKDRGERLTGAEAAVAPFTATGVRAKPAPGNNIDDILEAGVYWVASNAQTGGTWPVDTGVGTRYGLLEVMVGGSAGTVRVQRMTVYSTGIVYERIYANSQWYTWNCDASLAFGYTIGENSNLNDFTDIGNYRVTQASVAATITNTPLTDHGYLLKVMAGATAGITIQMAISGVGDSIHMRYKTGNTWGSWYKYTGTAQ